MSFLKSILGLLICSPLCAAPVNTDLPADAVKVTKENNPNCVEYYNYKGTMYCSLMTINTKPMDPTLLTYEKQAIQFDNRAWKAVWGEHKEAITTIEYIPVGQQINHWNELITSQFIPGLSEVSAKEFANRFLSDLKKTGVIYSSKIMYQQPTTVILEFQVKQPKNLQQDELQKIVKTNEGMFVLHYAIKKSDMGEKKRQDWISRLKASTLKK
jgi:hypothetical protein